MARSNWLVWPTPQALDFLVAEAKRLDPSLLRLPEELESVCGAGSVSCAELKSGNAALRVDVDFVHALFFELEAQCEDECNSAFCDAFEPWPVQCSAVQCSIQLLLVSLPKRRRPSTSGHLFYIYYEIVVCVLAFWGECAVQFVSRLCLLVLCMCLFYSRFRYNMAIFTISQKLCLVRMNVQY